MCTVTLITSTARIKVYKFTFVVGVCVAAVSVAIYLETLSINVQLLLWPLLINVQLLLWALLLNVQLLLWALLC